MQNGRSLCQQRSEGGKGQGFIREEGRICEESGREEAIRDNGDQAALSLINRFYIWVFFCKYNDPIYAKMEKLEIMIKLASDRNIDQVKFASTNLILEENLVNLSIKRIQKVIFLLTGGATLQFCLVLHKYNMSASLRLYWEWRLSAKLSLEWKKTAVFVLSTLQQIDPVLGQVFALVLCHTRELAYRM